MESPVQKLLNKNFVLVWQGQLISQIGNHAFFIAIIIYIKHATSSVVAVSLIILISRLPILLLGSIGGVLTDRFSRRNIMILCDCVSGLSILFLAFVSIIMPQKSPVIVVGIFIASVICSITDSFFRPALSAMLPDIVPGNKLSIANSLNQGTIQIARILGQGTAGILLRQIGAPVLFLLNGISYLFSAMTEWFIAPPVYLKAVKKSRGRIAVGIAEGKRDFTAGLLYVWKNDGLRSFLICLTVISFFVMSFVALLPFYLDDIVRCGTEWYGYLMAFFGIGAVAGFLLVNTPLLSPRSKVFLLVVFVIVTPSGLLIIALFPILSLVIVSFVHLGIMQGFLMIKMLTTIQMSTDYGVRGRVLGLFESVTHGLSTIAMVGAGIVSDLTGKNIHAVMIFCGITGTGLSMLLFLNKKFRESFIALSNQQTVHGTEATEKRYAAEGQLKP